MTGIKPKDVNARLQAAAMERQRNKWKDATEEALSKLLSKLPPQDQMAVICAYQAALILEMADGDKEMAKTIWQASWTTSANMMRSFHEATEPTNVN